MDLMKNHRRRKSKGVKLLKNQIAFVVTVVSVCCILILTMSALKLAVLSKSITMTARESAPEVFGLGKFGEMVVEMLPNDLSFTVFLPSKKAFERELRLLANATGMPQQEADNVYATLTRILGFSAVPRQVYSGSVSVGEEICLDSVSGFRLCISKDVDGSLVVNQVKSEQVDMKKGETVVHVMDGVIMDAEFAQSVQPDDEVDNKED